MKNDHLLQQIHYGATIAVYGSGGRAVSFLDHLKAYRQDVSVAFFLDSFTPGSFMGLERITLDQWLEHRQPCDMIIIASAYYEDIQQALLDRDVCDYYIYDGSRILDPPPPYSEIFRAFHKPFDMTCMKYLSSFKLGYDEEDVVKQIVRRIRNYTMVSLEGLFSLADMVRFCETQGIAGALVECGCCQGGATAMMAAMNLHSGGSRRDIHAFDSFLGLPEPVPGKDSWDEQQGWFGLPLNTSQFQGRRLYPLGH